MAPTTPCCSSGPCQRQGLLRAVCSKAFRSELAMAGMTCAAPLEGLSATHPKGLNILRLQPTCVYDTLQDTNVQKSRNSAARQDNTLSSVHACEYMSTANGSLETERPVDTLKCTSLRSCRASSARQAGTLSSEQTTRVTL